MHAPPRRAGGLAAACASLLLLARARASAQEPSPPQEPLSASTQAAAPEPAEVLSGVDVLARHGFQELQGLRVGLITNQTGKTRDGRSTVAVLAAAPGVRLEALFSPEHGFSGASEDASVASGTARLEDGRVLPLYSLYGATLAPTGQMLRGLDALVFDIQDAGARFYTYAATMGMAMESAAAANVAFFVLDRPNPVNGDVVEGPVLDPGIRHLTAYFPVPVRHGLTVGELARLHNLLGRVGARLQVVPMSGWRRELWYDETGLPWTPPSPNMPDLEAATLYPGVACLEYANLSVGRGTPRPFRWVGAPWLKAGKLLQRLQGARLEGVEFSLEDQVPSKSAYAGRKCRGVRLRVTDRARLKPLRVFAHLICALRDLHPKRFEPHWEQTRRMVGTDRFRELYESGAGPERMIEFFDKSAAEFESSRRAFLLY